MSAVELRIVQPAHDAGFEGSTLVTFQGEITRLPDELIAVPLFYRWYSSLFEADSTTDRYSMNANALNSPLTNYTHPEPLNVGSQVITLGAIDRPGEGAADLEAAQHGGVTGGSQGAGQCVIHVFIANIVAPANLAVLSLSAGVFLEAEAPKLWWRPTDIADVFEPNPDYHDLNRLQYRWRFVPLGPPAGRATVQFIPGQEEWLFNPDADPIVIRYRVPSSANLQGLYRLTLHVEDVQGVLTGHQSSIDITVNP